jgi:pimeloyl-ACP methyl ester carboxylesterase
MAARRTQVDIGDGHVEVEITGAGEPIVLIQTALSRDELRPLGRHLARSGAGCVYHYLRRGYAGSSPAHDQESVATDAADAAALVRVLHADPAHVVGVSYSAAVALALASSHPELVRTLTVVETPPTGTPSAAEFYEANRTILEHCKVHGPHRALDQFMTALRGPDWREASEREVPGSVEDMESDASAFFGHDIPALLAWRFGSPDAAQLRCPILVVAGGRSGSWFAEMHARLLSLLPHAVGATVEDAGHLVATTHPMQVGDLLLEHVGRHRGRPRPDLSC